MKRPTVIVIGLIILISPIALIITFKKNPTVKIPDQVKQQVNFPVSVLKPQKTELHTDESSFKFDKSQGILSFIVKDSNANITFAEQAYPEVLIFDKLVGTLNQYDEIQTKVGKVALTKPKSAGGNQVAALNMNNQTLIFARTTKDLANNQWQDLFNNLDIVK